VASSVKPVPSVATPAKKEDFGTRRQIIIDLLTQKGRLGIRDIALQIVGVSEKTVQRELAQLVIEGKVTKEGKKRWSTYGLII
jgi:DeoR/GlpR family transcriptional regulator of sugar metabolism